MSTVCEPCKTLSVCAASLLRRHGLLRQDVWKQLRESVEVPDCRTTAFLTLLASALSRQRDGQSPTPDYEREAQQRCALLS